VKQPARRAFIINSAMQDIHRQGFIENDSAQLSSEACGILFRDFYFPDGRIAWRQNATR
jgi:hypothetical protein